MGFNSKLSHLPPSDCKSFSYVCYIKAEKVSVLCSVFLFQRAAKLHLLTKMAGIIVEILFQGRQVVLIGVFNVTRMLG